ncbi:MULTISPECIES: acyl carrier protein [unclassified Corynebacterium]|uniref:acyl carrier protein n=1 Tax=unclassified Corynebacterium TaxID=2624378 RepID=UPI0029CA4FDD|nr:MULTISPECIES: acyl carrier protein [unclassified Corynebacterium]WPF65521.1 acyl carrier protein [Corynebacterium sp. 22KM0430]WPF68016.1 acyl carrier protein [Corynebacterium sp. 21KM1197]
MGNLADQLAAKFGAETQEKEKPEGTLARLALIVAEATGRDVQEIQPHTRLRDDTGATSLDLVEITVKTEEAFGVRLEGHTVADFDTVGDVVQFLDSAAR